MWLYVATPKKSRITDECLVLYPWLGIDAQKVHGLRYQGGLDVFKCRHIDCHSGSLLCFELLAILGMTSVSDSAFNVETKVEFVGAQDSGTQSWCQNPETSVCTPFWEKNIPFPFQDITIKKLESSTLLRLKNFSFLQGWGCCSAVELRFGFRMLLVYCCILLFCWCCSLRLFFPIIFEHAFLFCLVFRADKFLLEPV